MRGILKYKNEHGHKMAIRKNTPSTLAITVRGQSMIFEHSDHEDVSALIRARKRIDRWLNEHAPCSVPKAIPKGVLPAKYPLTSCLDGVWMHPDGTFFKKDEK